VKVGPDYMLFTGELLNVFSYYKKSISGAEKLKVIVIIILYSILSL